MRASFLKLDNAARVELSTGGYAMQSNRNVKNLNVGDDCFFEAISNTQAFNSSINLTDDHPAVKVNTAASADGAENWEGSTALTSYKFIRLRGENAPCWITVDDTQHGTVTASKNVAVKNESITLTAKPDTGYELDSVTVTDEEGNTVAVDKNTLTFNMPASDVTVTAAFALKKFTVTWKNGDTVLETDEDVPYGTTPAYDGETPSKASDDNHAYIFNGWSPEISAVTGNATYTAQFVQATRIAGYEPFIDENGAYILGQKAHYETDSKYYSVNNDGSIGEEVTEESLKISYFDFSLINNGTEYQINYYTGPTESLTKFEIPKTYNGKNITVLGNDNNERLYEGTKTQFELVLNENIREIKGYTFYVLYVTKVSGETSGLNKIGNYAFSWANSPDSCYGDWARYGYERNHLHKRRF